MPYISPIMRLAIDAGTAPTTSGELNYAFTREILRYIDVQGLDYSIINDIVGALEGAKAEFQRRVVAPYEDRKIAQNGDVYHAPTN